MIVSSYVIKFIIFSFMGWIYECIYCTVKTGHWDNRGFLFGPICPIYGFGALGAMIIFNEIPYFAGERSPIWQIFLICSLGSAILEYTVSLILEKKFHAMWWDYSDVPLNINGRICLPATLSFGVAGVVIVRYFFPWFLGLTHGMNDHPIVNEIVALIVIFVLGVDTAVSVASITQLLTYLDDVQEKFDERMEASVEMVAQAPDTIKEKLSEAPAMLKEKVTEAPSALKEKVTEAPSVLKEKALGLTRRQKYHLRSIKTFKLKEKTSLFENLRKELKNNDSRGH